MKQWYAIREMQSYSSPYQVSFWSFWESEAVLWVWWCRCILSVREPWLYVVPCACYILLLQYNMWQADSVPIACLCLALFSISGYLRWKCRVQISHTWNILILLLQFVIFVCVSYIQWHFYIVYEALVISVGYLLLPIWPSLMADSSAQSWNTMYCASVIDWYAPCGGRLCLHWYKCIPAVTRLTTWSISPDLILLTFMPHWRPHCCI